MSERPTPVRASNLVASGMAVGGLFAYDAATHPAPTRFDQQRTAKNSARFAVEEKEKVSLTAEEIVRALADANPNAHSYMWHYCVLCDATTPVKPTDHQPDCLWRAAVEWVEASA